MLKVVVCISWSAVPDFINHALLLHGHNPRNKQTRRLDFQPKSTILGSAMKPHSSKETFSGTKVKEFELELW